MFVIAKLLFRGRVIKFRINLNGMYVFKIFICLLSSFSIINFMFI